MTEKRPSLATKVRRENDYTLRAVTETADGGKLSRYFNFASENILTIYEKQVDNPAGASLAWHVHTENFEHLGSLDEVVLARRQLRALNGKPPNSPLLERAERSYYERLPRPPQRRITQP
jgi:hypothetical protein